MKLLSTDGSKKYRVIGGALTLAWLALVFMYVAASPHSLFGMPPNELGDFLAGVLGPIGILWLILGFWQQGDELRSSVRALEMQSEELRSSVEQQKALVEVTRLQVQYEIDAQHEERQARHEAGLPNLHLSNDGGEQSGSDFKSRMRLINLGADCANLKIFDLDNEFPNLIHSQMALRTGEIATFPIIHTNTDHTEFDIEVVFNTRSGESEGVLFSLTRLSPNSIGFSVVRS